MKIRTFQAKSMHDAIQSIKSTLGPDAVILSTKRIRSWDNGFGLLSRSGLEVVAAVEDDATVPPPAPLLGEDAPTAVDAARVSAASMEESRFQQTLQGAIERPTQRPQKSVRPWMERAGAAPTARQDARSAAFHSFQRVYEDLLAQGVEQATAEGCLRELQETLIEPGQASRPSSVQLLRTVLLSRATTSGPLLNGTGEQKIALFVGPSGVGKTSTIAKLATQYGIVEQRSVALITMDTYRPAAVEHLRLYAEVLGIDLTVAHSCDDAAAAIEAAREAELILIDTAGFSPYEPASAQRWRGLLTGAHPMDVHLVLAAGTRVPDLMVSINRCVDLPSLRLLFTKLDETSGYGGIFETAHRTGVPLSYWGTGQRVPDDLTPAQVDRLGDLLLGGQVRAPLSGANIAWDRATAPIEPSNNQTHVR